MEAVKEGSGDVLFAQALCAAKTAEKALASEDTRLEGRYLMTALKRQVEPRCIFTIAITTLSFCHSTYLVPVLPTVLAGTARRYPRSVGMDVDPQ